MGLSLTTTHEIYLSYTEDRHEIEPFVEQYLDHGTDGIDFTLHGAHLTAPSWSETVKIDFEPKVGDEIFVVVIRYYDGDSFGRTYGHWHIGGAFPTEKRATEWMEAIISDRPPMKNGHRYYQEWEGYFAGLESNEVVKLYVGE